MSLVGALRRHPRTTALAGAAAAAVLVAAIAVLASGGDSDSDAGGPPPRACTLIACSSGLTVHLPAPPARTSAARVCIDGACGAAQPLGATGRIVSARLPEASRRAGARVRVAVELLDERGRLLDRLAGGATVTRSRPNGPDCPPVCLQAETTLRGGG